MITKGYWVHKNSMDMFIEILSVPFIGPNYTKIKYRCWNYGQGNSPYPILMRTYRTKILKDQYQNWTRTYPNKLTLIK